ncbi:hypothetical protein H6P81_018850 [Aristolochia fimbriata]|uniref:Pectinesterase catalytic domain-containing protein n=1 Tax=Aristolochia fimbriata TaxID=158543 RepID=A0AAV7E5C0_ARIFI|nr:hypothetical protein H6P81_018850 [Aristolochia fimbriata]
MPYTRREKILDACIVITFVATVCTAILFALLLTVLRPRCPVQKILPSITVASDGSGDFTTVSAAVAAAPSQSRKYFGIAIKPGVYYEEVRVPKEKTRLAFIGGGMGVTVISSNRSWASPLEDTATLGCSVDASPGSDQSGSPPVFLGRPGGAYSRVVFMQSYLGGLLSPTGTGWLFDSSLPPATTLYLKEYNNRGSGVGPAERRISTGEAAQFTVGSFINRDKWFLVRKFCF